MTKTAFTFCMALLCGTFTYGQPTFEVSEPYEVVDGFYKSYFNIDDYVYSIKVPESNPIIQKFDPTGMTEISRSELELPSKSFFEGFENLNGKTVIFYSRFDKKSKEHLLFARSINMNELSWGEAEQLLLRASREIKTLEPPEAFFEPVRRFTFYRSSDQSKLLVKYKLEQESSNPRKNYERFGLSVFDTDLNTIWSREENMPYEQSKLIITELTVDNAGNAYMLGAVYHDHYLYWTGYPLTADIPGFDEEIFSFSAVEKRLRVIKPDFTRPHVTQVHFVNDYMNNAAITGFYSRNEEEPVESFFFMPLKPDGKLGNNDVYPISTKQLSADEKRFAKAENRSPMELTEGDLRGLWLNQIQPTADGGTVMVFHHQYTYMDHHERNLFRGLQIVALKLNSAREVSWIRYMPKNQTSQAYNDPAFYCYAYSSSSLHFLFMDHLNNVEMKQALDLTEYTEPGYANLTAYVLDENSGELSKKIILNTGNVDNQKLAKAKASRIVLLPKNQFLFEGYKGKKEDVMVKVNLK